MSVASIHEDKMSTLMWVEWYRIQTCQEYTRLDFKYECCSKEPVRIFALDSLSRHSCFKTNIHFSIAKCETEIPKQKVLVPNATYYDVICMYSLVKKTSKESLKTASDALPLQSGNIASKPYSLHPIIQDKQAIAPRDLLSKVDASP